MNIDENNNRSTVKYKRGPKRPKKISKRYLENSGLAYLQRFTSASENFRTVMMRKIQRSCQFHTEQDPEECAQWLDELIQRFQKNGLLDDESYTRGTITSLRHRGLSAKAIIFRLKAKGLPQDMITTILSEIDQEREGRYNTDTCCYSSEFIAALKLAKKKKIGPYRPVQKEEDYNKELGVLARAGYNYDTAKHILDLDKNSAEEALPVQF